MEKRKVIIENEKNFLRQELPIEKAKSVICSKMNRRAKEPDKWRIADGNHPDDVSEIMSELIKRDG